MLTSGETSIGEAPKGQARTGAGNLSGKKTGAVGLSPTAPVFFADGLF